jgi:hypothetical protein
MSVRTRKRGSRIAVPPRRNETLPGPGRSQPHRTAPAPLKVGGEFLVTARHERTSKAGSLKRNYGGVDIQKERNTEAINRLREEYERSRVERR